MTFPPAVCSPIIHRSRSGPEPIYVKTQHIPGTVPKKLEGIIIGRTFSFKRSSFFFQGRRPAVAAATARATNSASIGARHLLRCQGGLVVYFLDLTLCFVELLWVKQQSFRALCRLKAGCHLRPAA